MELWRGDYDSLELESRSISILKHEIAYWKQKRNTEGFCTAEMKEKLPVDDMVIETTESSGSDQETRTNVARLLHRVTDWLARQGMEVNG